MFQKVRIECILVVINVYYQFICGAADVLGEENVNVEVCVTICRF